MNLHNVKFNRSNETNCTIGCHKAYTISDYFFYFAQFAPCFMHSIFFCRLFSSFSLLLVSLASDFQWIFRFANTAFNSSNIHIHPHERQQLKLQLNFSIDTNGKMKQSNTSARNGTPKKKDDWKSNRGKNFGFGESPGVRNRGESHQQKKDTKHEQKFY